MYEVSDGLRVILAKSIKSVVNKTGKFEVIIEARRLAEAQYLHKELVAMSQLTERHDQQIDTGDEYTSEEDAKYISDKMEESLANANKDKEQIASELGAVYSPCTKKIHVKKMLTTYLKL